MVFVSVCANADRTQEAPVNPSRRRLARLVCASAVVAAGLSGCATTPRRPADASAATRVIGVVAAENVWGSLAQQLGGSRVTVASIIDNPDADPHDYEPTAADGRAVAAAKMVIYNGIGYDAWAGKMVDTNPSQGRVVLDVGHVVGVNEGGNPHQWYSPTHVRQVVDEITADYKRIDPGDAAFFDSEHDTVLGTNLKEYFGLVDEIRTRYAGTPVGASESIVAPLAEATGLTLLTPESFLDAVSEGGDPTAADKATIDKQITTRQLKVYVFNSQNATPDVQAQVNAAKAAGIAVSAVTETLTPAGASFQDWQVRQLTALRQALARATGR
jgi:zinc/manganese transport system substrate-binding protein